MRHLPFVAKNADAQVGKIVGALDAKGILDDTLIVITADHAAQTGSPFFGLLAPGVDEPAVCPAVDRDPVGLQLVLRPGRRTRSTSTRARPWPRCATGWPGNLAFSYQDTQVAAYLNDTSLAKKKEAAAAVLDMPGVMASYYINGEQNDYTRFDTNKMTGAERAWFVQHGDELVDTMANRSAPDVVGITARRTSRTA